MRFERMASRLGIVCSILLSYRDICKNEGDKRSPKLGQIQSESLTRI